MTTQAPAASIPRPAPSLAADPRAVLGESLWRRPAFGAAAWLVLALADFEAAFRGARPLPPGPCREARPWVRALAVELILANYRLPRPAVEALVGDQDAAGGDSDAWSACWLGPVVAATRAAGPRAAALAGSREGSIRIGPGGMVGTALPG